MPRTGLEPACLSTHAPETCASTNSATWAKLSSIISKKQERKTRLELATLTLARLCSTNWAISANNLSWTVKRRRLELPRHNCHYPLKVARLPIPPPLQNSKSIISVPRTGLEPACLSTHAPETCASTNSATWAKIIVPTFQRNMSGKRDSNSRP